MSVHRDPRRKTWYYVLDLPRGDDRKRRQKWCRGFPSEALAKRAEGVVPFNHAMMVDGREYRFGIVAGEQRFVEAFAEGIRRVIAADIEPEACRANARRFARARFVTDVREVAAGLQEGVSSRDAVMEVLARRGRPPVATRIGARTFSRRWMGEPRR